MRVYKLINTFGRPYIYIYNLPLNYYFRFSLIKYLSVIMSTKCNCLGEGCFLLSNKTINNVL